MPLGVLFFAIEGAQEEESYDDHNHPIHWAN
jgi:hypothetical protein